MLDQTRWLVPAQATALAGTLLLALVFYYLYARHRHRFLGVWSLAWSVYALRFVAELIGTLTGFASGAAVASLSVTLASSILLLSGTYGFLSKPLPRAWVATGAVGMLWILLATPLETDFLILATPTALVTAAAYLGTGWVILHSRMIQGTGKLLAGWAFAAWTVVKLLYPVFGKIDQWAEWGFLTTAALETSVAVGFLLMYFEGSRADVARSEERMRTRALQQEAVAQLGQRALAGTDLGELFNEAVHTVGRILQVAYCEVLELLPPGDKLVLRAALPGKEDLIGQTVIEAGQSSQAGYTLKCREPVVMSDITTETRFTPHHLMHAHGIVSGMSVVIEGREPPFGVLNASSTQPRRFTENDINFLKSLANILAAAMERKQAEDALYRSESSLRSIFKAAPIGIGVVHNRVLTQVNDRLCDMLGYAGEDLLGHSARMLYPTDSDFDFVGREKYLQIQARGTGSVETRWQRKGGEIIDVLLSSTPLDPSDRSKGVTFTALDITASKQAEQDRLRLEERLRQAQKMEAIGTLAGGIAHDFNNILAAIIGFAELAKIEAQDNDATTTHLTEVLKASFRARNLVRQILTFSRQGQTEFGPIQIQLVVKEALKLLRASLPSTIQVHQDLASETPILGDPTQIHQVVMNLCTNAYQAMQERGGVLEVSLSETQVGVAPPPELRSLPQGPYLRLRVQDSGPGIDTSIIHRIFDPYFSTKEKSKGTGLGLAVVHGIVKSHRGAIKVSSRLGAGATFDVYFPMIQEAAAMTAADPEKAVVGGRERILFVDDEPAIAILGKRMMESLGYEVTTCGNAIDALELFRLYPSAFDLVMTDMTMPQLTGDRMALQMMSLRPDLPVIICTGFNELLSKERVQEIGIRALLMKPFLRNEAATVIRQVLDQR